MWFFKDREDVRTELPYFYVKNEGFLRVSMESLSVRKRQCNSYRACAADFIHCADADRTSRKRNEKFILLGRCLECTRVVGLGGICKNPSTQKCVY